MEKIKNRDKFLDLVTADATETRTKILDRNKNRKFLRLSQKIALNIRQRLEQLDWSQKQLAQSMEVSPQQVNKWLKGKENFTIGTLVQLGDVLGIDLIQTPSIEDDCVTASVSPQLILQTCYVTYTQTAQVSIFSESLEMQEEYKSKKVVCNTIW